MPRTTLRIPDEMEETASGIKHEYGMTKAEQFRTAYRQWIRRNEDERIPEWARIENVHEQIINENNPKMRALNFKERVHGKLSQFLRDDDGNIARHPPHPDKVEELYAESVRREIDEEYATYGFGDEFHEHLQAELEWYRMMHPDTNDGSKGQQAREYVEWVWRNFGKDKAKEVVKSLGEYVDAPSEEAWQEVFDDVRARVKRENYKDKWDQAVHGKL